MIEEVKAGDEKKESVSKRKKEEMNGKEKIHSSANDNASRDSRILCVR